MNLFSLKTITIAILAIVPLSLNFSLVVRAEPPINSGNIAQKIVQNPFQSSSEEESTDDSDPQMSATRQRCFEYLKTGWELEESGNKDEALEHYKKAIDVEPDNGWAWLFAGHLLGDTDCVEKALDLFKQQDDAKGQKLALEVLQEINARSD
jgi:tetratricopeptide (TPR) repeat protein